MLNCARRHVLSLRTVNLLVYKTQSKKKIVEQRTNLTWNTIWSTFEHMKYAHNSKILYERSLKKLQDVLIDLLQLIYMCVILYLLLLCGCMWKLHGETYLSLTRLNRETTIEA